MNKLRKEKTYLKYLEKNYAEAENYDKKLLQIIEKEKLAELFLD
jgi:flagellum-specific peptidoglycan hydrolase FlgJ